MGVCRPLGLGCSSCCAPPRDSDAQSSHARERKCVTTCTTAHTPRARCTSARSLASHARTAQPHARSLLGSLTKEVCEKRSMRRVTTRITVEHSARTRHMHDNTQCTTHAHVSCTVVPSRLASAFHRPPTLLRGFGAQSLYVQEVYIAVGCSSCCAPPRDSDAQSPHARERKSVTTYTTPHTPRARCTSARSLALHAHTAQPRARSLLGSPTKEVCEKRSTRRVTTRITVEHSARTQHMHDNTQCTTHAHVSCTVVPSRLASAFHRPPTLLRGFGAQSLYVQEVYIAAGCSSCCAPPRDSDAQSPHARERKCVTICTTAHTPRARCTSARSLALHAHTAQPPWLTNQGGM